MKLSRDPVDFDPKAVMFAPHHRDQILISDVGIALWFGAVCWGVYTYGFAEVFRVYLVPYLWWVLPGHT